MSEAQSVNRNTFIRQLLLLEISKRNSEAQNVSELCTWRRIVRVPFAAKL
jgi:hypothetical protein